jgi:GT2 family glycosyltransferase
VPAVSIVCATYNRSNILKLTLEAARRQTWQDWELLVVGDRCTDDTADVVAAIGDPRIRFENLPVNHGEQSVPSNIGVERTTGEFIAFLNHDDLWFPDHLECLLAVMADPRVEAAFTLGANWSPPAPPRLVGVTDGGRYQPWHEAPASSWLVRRRVWGRFGPWRPSTETVDLPSQDCLVRAHQAGVVIRGVERLTIAQINSASERDSYRLRKQDAHAPLFARFHENPERLRQDLLTMIAVATSATARYFATGAALREVAVTLVRRVTMAVGVLPRVLNLRLRYGRRGNYIAHLRRVRGLPSIRPHD